MGWPLKRPAGPIWIPKIEAVWAGGIYLVRQEGAQCILRLEQCILAKSLEQRTGLPLCVTCAKYGNYLSISWQQIFVFFLWTENDTIIYEVRCEQDMNKTAPSASLSWGSWTVFLFKYSDNICILNVEVSLSLSSLSFKQHNLVFCAQLWVWGEADVQQDYLSFPYAQ